MQPANLNSFAVWQLKPVTNPQLINPVNLIQGTLPAGVTYNTQTGVYSYKGYTITPVYSTNPAVAHCNPPTQAYPWWHITPLLPTKGNPHSLYNRLQYRVGVWRCLGALNPTWQW